MRAANLAVKREYVMRGQPWFYTNSMAGQHQEGRAEVELSLKNLMSFPFVQKAVEAGELELHGAYFGVANGRLSVRDPKTGEFSDA